MEHEKRRKGNMYASGVYPDWDPRGVNGVWGHTGVSPSSEHYRDATLPSREEAREQGGKRFVSRREILLPFPLTPGRQGGLCSRFLN